MNTLFKPVALALLLVPTFAWSQSAAAAVDWTPFFKAWEQGCAVGKDESTLKKNLFKTNKGGHRLQFNRVVLPQKYAQTIGQPTVKRNQARDGSDKTIAVFIPIKNGTYYGIPIVGYEYTQGEDSGISVAALTLAGSASEINNKLKAVKYRVVGDDEMGLEFQASLENARPYRKLVCNVSM